MVNPVGYSAFVDEVRIGTTFETGLPSGGGTPGPADSLGVDLGRNTGQDFYNFWTEAPDMVVQWDAADKTNPSRSFDEFGRFTATFTEALSTATAASTLASATTSSVREATCSRTPSRTLTA